MRVSSTTKIYINNQMKLHIRFGSLDAFDLLYKRSELLQDVLIKESGIRWRFDKENRDEIDRLLKGRKINYVIG